jgi:hypothetical protein
MYKIVIAVALAVVGGFTYWFWSQSRQTPAPVVPPVPVVAPRPPPQPDTRPEGQIQHPIPKPAPEPRARALPSLDESDAAVRDRLSGLFGAKRLAEYFLMEGFIRRLVATVDNLPREQVASDSWPTRPVRGELVVDTDGSGLMLSTRNQERYLSRVRLAESVDPKRLVDTYARLYPLFQEAYRDLGYPKGYFNDRLIEVIDHLLQTPEVTGLIRLKQPNIRYEFADPDLQSRSAGQKILLRMGPEQARRIKEVLRAIRAEILKR